MNLHFNTKALTPNHIAEILSKRVELSFEQRSGMSLMATALSHVASKEPVVFKCPDGTLLKIQVYDPEGDRAELKKKIDEAWQDGYYTAKKY